MNVWELCPFDFCEFAFMQRALVAAALVGLAAPSIGVFLVQRRLSLMGDGIGHVTLVGVGAGFLLGTSPVVLAIVAAALGAVAIELLRERGRAAGDVALAVIFYGGLAGGILIMSLGGASPTSMITYLFGSVLLVDGSEIAIIAIVATAVLALTFALRKPLFAVCYDEEVARVSGISVRSINLLIAIAAAITIGVSMRVVGILLVSAMLVLPVAAVQQLTRSFSATVSAGLALGLVTSVGGLIAAYYLNSQPGGTIVVGAIIAFVVATILGRRSVMA
ncbi:MAG: metal ABC transporter permease [Actinomycetota bacterium]